MQSILNSTVSRVKKSLGRNRLIAHTVFSSRIRKLAIESKKRGDDYTKDSEKVPLTPSQLEFIRQDAVSPNTSINTIAGAVVIDVPMTDSDVEILREAINKVIKNNDGMRIKFVEDGGILKQYATAYEPPEIPLLKFDSEDEMKKYCDLKAGEPFGCVSGENFNYEINIFRLSDGRGGVTMKEHHLRTDAVGLVAFTVYWMDVYEKIKNGRNSYEGARTSFIDHAKRTKGSGSAGVGTNEQVDAASNRIGFTLNKEKTHQLEETCKRIGKETNLNIRPSKLFELANAVYISRLNGNVEKITLNSLSTGRRPKTSDNFTLGMYVYSRPLDIFLDWEATIKENIVAAKKRAKGVLKNSLFSEKRAFSEPLFISFRSNLGILKTLFRTPFYLYEGPRKYSPVPLLMHIEDMNESGEYSIMYDYWKMYSKEQMQHRHEAVMNIIDLMVKNPEMKLKELSATLAPIHVSD